MKMGGRGVFLSFGAVALLAGGALLVSSARRGWIPHDEGLLAQSAERVLAGELPHRDFDAAYTGGLELLHAAAFRLLGEDLSSLRWTLLAFALAFVCALYVLASRIAAPPLAAALSIAGVAWSLPNYFAALPSWYVLFLWTFGGVFLSAYARRRRAGWLVAAGACAGLAFLAKTPGILLLAAAFLFLVFDDQALAAREPPAQPSRSLLWPLAGALVLFLAGLLALVARQLGPMEVLLYLVPSAALSGLLLRQEARLAGGAPRARRLLARGLALAAGAAVPIALFLVPYALSGSLDDFWRGTFVLPQRRFDHASFPLPPVWTAAAALPLAIPLALPSAFGRLRPWILGGAAIALGGVLLALAGREPVYRAILVRGPAPDPVRGRPGLRHALAAAAARARRGEGRLPAAGARLARRPAPVPVRLQRLLLLHGPARPARHRVDRPRAGPRAARLALRADPRVLRGVRAPVAEHRLGAHHRRHVGGEPAEPAARAAPRGDRGAALRRGRLRGPRRRD